DLMNSFSLIGRSTAYGLLMVPPPRVRKSSFFSSRSLRSLRTVTPLTFISSISWGMLTFPFSRSLFRINWWRSVIVFTLLVLGFTKLQFFFKIFKDLQKLSQFSQSARNLTEFACKLFLLLLFCLIKLNFVTFG